MTNVKMYVTRWPVGWGAGARGSLDELDLDRDCPDRRLTLAAGTTTAQAELRRRVSGPPYPPAPPAKHFFRRSGQERSPAAAN